MLAERFGKFHMRSMDPQMKLPVQGVSAIRCRPSDTRQMVILDDWRVFRILPSTVSGNVWIERLYVVG